MDRLAPRHRRRAGSGPPANALIAWIGTDPYLREAAATASYQREMALPLPSRSRSAKMAVAACFVLACGAILGSTTIISHGRGTAAYQIATSSPGQRVTAAAPVGIAPMLADGAASKSAGCGALPKPKTQKSNNIRESHKSVDPRSVDPGDPTYRAERAGPDGTTEQPSACEVPRIRR